MAQSLETRSLSWAGHQHTDPSLSCTRSNPLARVEVPTASQLCNCGELGGESCAPPPAPGAEGSALRGRVGRGAPFTGGEAEAQGEETYSRSGAAPRGSPAWSGSSPGTTAVPAPGLHL